MCRMPSVCLANRPSTSPAFQVNATRDTMATVASVVIADQPSTLSAQAAAGDGAMAVQAHTTHAIANSGQRSSGVIPTTLMVVNTIDVVATNTGTPMTIRRTTVVAGTRDATSRKVASSSTPTQSARAPTVAMTRAATGSQIRVVGRRVPTLMTRAATATQTA